MKRMLFYLICSLIPFAATAGSIEVAGTVADSLGAPIPGALVLVKHGPGRATTDRKGFYSISAGERDTLVFRFLGFGEQQIPVQGRKRIDLRMRPANEDIDKVVVLAGDSGRIEVEYACSEEPVAIIGYGSAPRQGFVGAPDRWQSPNTEEYARYAENRFRSALDEPLSTFALEADGASYTNCRRMILAGRRPSVDAVRIEEFVNYFPYDYPAPEGCRPLSLTVDAGPCPWNPAHRLARIALRAREIPSAELPPAHLVCLIDVSGSMRRQMPLVQASMKMLADNLRPADRVSIVTYANGVKEVLTAVPGSERRRIKDAVNALEARGGTAGGAGLEKAYEAAVRHFIPGGNNRIILCTDGDFNIGRSSDEAIEELIEQRRKETGVQLSVLGYGMGNYKDKKMQLIAEKGNGNYAYIDDLREASKVLFHEFGSTVHTAAADVKMQVEFNPALVASYRLVGYESRLLNNEDFNDDRKDAGEIGAGHSVTALYEIIPVGAEEHPAGTVDALRYQSRSGTPVVTIPSAEMLAVKVRYKLPGEERSRLMEEPLRDDGAAELTGDFAFAAAVAMYAQLLKVSDFRGDATWDDVIALAERGIGEDPGGYRRAFVDLVRTTKYLK
ncbi:YfbK domain-containing protein [Alistipes sp.]|uniref:YfbK domain-containing protein n=1 Tax=Alistipes sp. TaxID=1872444 RepID=UPI003AEF8C4B